MTTIAPLGSTPPSSATNPTRERASCLLTAVSALTAADLPLEHHPRRRGLLSALALIHSAAVYGQAHGVCAANPLRPGDPEVQPTPAACAAVLLELARACPSDELADAVRSLRRTWLGRRAPTGADAPEIVLLRAAAVELKAKGCTGRDVVGVGSAS